MQVERAERREKKQPATVRVAMWSARHRWLVFGLWFVCAIGLYVIGLGLGTQLDDGTSINGSSKIEAFKASDVFNAGGGAAASDNLIVVVSHPTLKVNDPDYKTVVSAISAKLRAATYNEDGKPQPIFSQVIDTYSAPLPGLGLTSQDNTSTRILGTVTGEFELRKKKLEPVKPLLKTFGEQYPTFQVYTFNNYLLNQEVNTFVAHELDGSLKLTLPLTFIILLVAFGAVAAAVVPLILAVTSLLAAFGILAIYSQAVAPVDSNATQVIVLIGLAVGIDYSLFMITRYRTERRHGREKMAAIEVASSTAGRAVFFSGLTVMISLAGLYLVGDNIFNSIATGTIGVVLVSVIGSLTFLPATLSILGNGVNWGRLPYFGRDREEGSGFWATLVGAVMRRPLVFSLGVLVLLLALASPILHFKLGTNGLDGLPTSLDGVKALKLMDAKWSQGTTLKMNVIVTGFDRTETKAALEQFKEAALKINGLSGPVDTTPSRNGKVVSLSFYMGGSRNSDLNHDIVKKVRADLIPTYFGKLGGVEAYVSGQAASTVDLVQYYLNAMPAVFGFVLGLSFLLLLVAFHSLVIPIKAILLNLLSTGAAYGAMVLVFQDGYLSEQIGFKPTGVIENFAPLFMFTIMFGLSMDYHLFILTRIKEAKDKGATSNEAVAKGISVTSGTITSAAAIMVVVFGVFVTLQMIIIRQLGFGLAVAVLVDATLIRCVLLPATMRLLGDWNWWIPKFLDWIPQVTIEGASEDFVPTEQPVEVEKKAHSEEDKDKVLSA